MKNLFHFKIAVVLLCFASKSSLAQKEDSLRFDNQFGASVSYTGFSVIESATADVSFHYTLKHHAVSLSIPFLYQGLFPSQNEWERAGLSLSYQYFPLRTNRLFSPYLFYKLHYFYSKSRRFVKLKSEAGASYGAIKEATAHGLAHHFGIGVRSNLYKGFFLNFQLGAGPSTFGQSVKLRSLHQQHEDQHIPEGIFKYYETALMFSVGIAYQLSTSAFKKANNSCCP